MIKKEAISLAVEKARFYLRDSRNLVLRQFGLLKLSTLILALTDKCNLKCVMCDIWERKGEESRELDFSKIRQLLELDDLKQLKHISLTGGEPFLRKDLCEIVLAIQGSYPRSSITISSNGTLTGQIMDFLRRTQQYTNISIELSLLGIKTHDDISGIKGSFANLENTIHEVRNGFPALNLKAKFVITPWNYLTIKETADYCREQNIPLMFKIVENVRSYTNSLKYRQNLVNKSLIFNAEQLKSIIDALKKLRNSRTVNRVCTGQLINCLEGKKISKKCFVPFLSLFINSEGSIYRCRMHDPIGSISKDPFNFITAGNQLAENRLDGDSQMCGQCVSLLRFLM